MNCRGIWRSYTQRILKTVTKGPKIVTITGAAGNIGYTSAFSIAKGEMLGDDQPVILNLIDLPGKQDFLEGMKMELEDCDYPLLHSVLITSCLSAAFRDSNYALLVASIPVGDFSDRRIFMKNNAQLAADVGKAINDYASRDIKCLFVSNPVNTNAMICSHFAKDIPKTNFHALTRIDHSRGVNMISKKLGVRPHEISKFCVWGNHSHSLYPDISHATVNGFELKRLLDKKWLESTFIPKLHSRGFDIMHSRGLWSVAGTSEAAILHMEEWALGTNGEWTSFSVHSDGSYGIPEGLFSSFPVICDGNGQFEIVKDLQLDEDVKAGIEITVKDLLQERELIEGMLK